MRLRITIFLFATIAAHPFESVAAPSPSPAAVLMQKHLVDIGGGRRLNLVCVGRGSPTIIFDYALGSKLLTWRKVVGPVSQFARACFYDRAGYGFSDPPGRPSTAAHVAEDLHRLLHRSGERLPVILVGHSLGGLYATLYADMYPGEVAGLVLIDPSLAEQDKDRGAEDLARQEVAFARRISRFRYCAALARSGRLASETHGACFAPEPGRTPEEKAFLDYQLTRPDRYETIASELESQHSADGRSDVNSRQEVAARRSFGAMPVIVLTPAEPSDPAKAEAQSAAPSAFWQSWKAGHDRLAARSSRGKSVVVSRTGHFIQSDQPQAVIDAIKEVAARAQRP